MCSNTQLLLLSASAPYGHTYLEYAKEDILDLLKLNRVKEVLFIPYALRDHESYTLKVRNTLESWGFKVKGIHTSDNPRNAVESAQAIFIGGGNTFQLLKSLYDNDLIKPLRHQVLAEGIPYIGSSAGTNVATVNICTTNDMPIVQPPSFEALGLVPFNINPHYLDPLPEDKHQGETREERINQFLEIPGNGPVLGLREGATLKVNGFEAKLKGISSAKLFQNGKSAQELEVGSDLSFLLRP